MTQVYLKSQWFLRTDGQQCFLTSENTHHTLPKEYETLLLNLQRGIEAQSIADEDFVKLTYLNGRGFITIARDPNAPAWELIGSNYSTILEQFKHHRLSVEWVSECPTLEKYASLLSASFAEEGIQSKNGDASIYLLLCNNYDQVQSAITSEIWNARNSVVLPVVMGRMKVLLGPILLPSDKGIKVSKAKAALLNYMPLANYDLPKVFVHLSSAWVAAEVMQQIALTKLQLVDYFIEFNMITGEKKLCPLR